VTTQQHSPHVNLKVSLDWMVQAREQLVRPTTIASQPALLILIATTEKPSFASKKDYGSRSDIYTQLPLDGFQELITWQALSKWASKEKTARSGRFSSALSPSTPI
jgi:hypothetical protein